MSLLLQLLLRKAGYAFHTSAEKEVVRTMKEAVCHVAFKPSDAEEQVRTGAYAPSKFTLPDGNVVQVCRSYECLCSFRYLGCVCRDMRFD